MNEARFFLPPKVALLLLGDAVIGVSQSMIKMYMNEPYVTHHEFAQAYRLAQILDGIEHDGNVWLCLNFNLGGKTIDAAVITEKAFTIIELKAVGGDVDCGTSLENSQWRWKEHPHDVGHVIATAPYANPFSQVKSYRTAAVGELEHRQRKFLGNTTLLKANVNFAWWVKGCVLLSQRDATDVRVVTGEIPYGTKKWFCCGSLGDLAELMRGLEATVSVAPKEVERLIKEVLGLQRVNAIIENLAPTDAFREKDAVVSSDEATSLSRFRRRYGGRKGPLPPKVDKKKADLVIHEEEPGRINDFSTLDKLLAKTTGNATRSDAQEKVTTVVASKKPFQCGFLKMTLSGEMKEVVPEYGSLKELEGDEAVAAVRESCPELDHFEVSKVLRFGAGVSVESKEAVRDYFRLKYLNNHSWYCLGYANGCVDFVFGKSLPRSQISAGEESSRIERPISSNFHVARWVHDFVENEAEGLPPLSVSEVQKTTNLSAEDVRRYAKTYFPRSCGEAFVVLDWLLGDEVISRSVSVLDVGCGNGGASLGCFFALHKHAASGQSEIRIDGVDVNVRSLAFAENLFKRTQANFLGRKVVFMPHEIDILKGFRLTGKYDLVLASKSIGEMVLEKGAGCYAAVVRKLAGLVNEDGMMMLIDIPKHRDALNAAIAPLQDDGFEGWSKQLTIMLHGIEDKENFICACLTRGTSGIVKE